MTERASGSEKKALLRLLRFLARGPASMTPRDDGVHAEIENADAAVQIIKLGVIAEAAARGLIHRDAHGEGDRIALEGAGRAYLKRAAARAEETFLAQHADLVDTTVEVDDRRGVVKVQPLADWTSRDVWRYIWRHGIPYNTLHDHGYPSIGCVPCTTSVNGTHADERAGRWRGTGKIECGLHGR